MLSTGISGSATALSRSQTRCSLLADAVPSAMAFIDFERSPARTRIGALQVLHLGEHVPEVLGVHAAFAMPRVGLRGGPAQCGRTEVLIDARRPAHGQLGKRRRDARSAHALIDLVGREQLAGEAPQVIERALRAALTLFGAVPQAREPAAAEAVVIACLLERLGGDRCQARVC